ncbi:MAG: hypothetical protein K2W97_05300 [Chthoniobacterales bacterium]|nr:hypothetical protein [Chthoniobacterales bacterium]
MDNKQVAYFGSQEQAVEDLKKIQGWLGQQPVTLYFHPAKNALVKRAWYHFLDPRLWSHFYSKNEYFLINSIGAKIIPSTQEDTGPFKDKEEMKQFLQNVFLPLKNYLSLPLIWKSYDLLEGNVLNQSTNKGEGLLNFSPRDPIKLTEFLREYYKIELDAETIVGTGGWGTVYKAASAEQKYAVKIAKPQSSTLEKSSSIVKWRRLHELAASRLHLRNLVETDLIILGIESKNDMRYCAIKPHQIKKFEQGPIWKRFLTIDPSTEMSVIVQVMKEAPGESLQTIMHRGDTFTPGTSAFNSFLNGSCSFIEDAMYANFVHLDIKPENVYFDQNKGILTLIDTGFSVRGAKRYQDEKERVLKTKTKTDQPLTNPRTFQYLAGTYGHRPSKQRQHKPYGAEMNGERLMLFALRLISREDYSKLRGLEDSPTKSFLSHYLDQLDSESKTVKAFNEHPEIREVIDLTLQLAEIDSGETEKMETLFTRWQKVFHSFQQKYGYEERTDFSAIHMKEKESNL